MVTKGDVACAGTCLFCYIEVDEGADSAPQMRKIKIPNLCKWDITDPEVVWNGN